MKLKKLFAFIGLTVLFPSMANSQETSDSTLITAFIDALNEGESYSVKFHSQGCFHRTEDSIMIKKEGELYFASHANGRFKILDKNEMEAIRQFEQRLQKPFDGGCTTVNEYILTTREGSFLIAHDGSCAWSGWYDLKTALGWP